MTIAEECQVVSVGRPQRTVIIGWMIGDAMLRPPITADHVDLAHAWHAF
jgi:hypothetical protein